MIKSVTITKESNVTIAYTEYQMHNIVQFCCKEFGFALDTTFSLCGIYWSQTFDTESKDGLILTLESILGPVIIYSLRDRKLFGIFSQQLLSKKHKIWEYFGLDLEFLIHHGFKIVIPSVKQLVSITRIKSQRSTLVKLLERTVSNTIKNKQAS